MLQYLVNSKKHSYLLWQQFCHQIIDIKIWSILINQTFFFVLLFKNLFLGHEVMDSFLLLAYYSLLLWTENS